MNAVTLSDLQDRADFDASERRVLRAIEHAFSSREELVRFLGRYVSWNGHFGSGVATLAGRISRHRHLFVDPKEPIRACADRSVHVAGFFFDAARDEFDDSATPHRDAHRSLAQALLKGVVAHTGLLDRADELLDDPDWLTELNRLVYEGYGLGRPGTRRELFAGMGFHVGSEILADDEFTLLDGRMRKQLPDLVDDLLNTRVQIAGEYHPAYYWVGIHSGIGGGVEHDHFEWAIRGVREALSMTPEGEREEARAAVLAGFDLFCELHRRFFEGVLT